MQKLMIALLVSLSALLLAAAGMARHIRFHRAEAGALSRPRRVCRTRRRNRLKPCLGGETMNRELSTPIAGSVAPTSVSPWLRSAGIVLAGSILLAVCAHVSLPLWFTPVPLSLQPFGVLLLGLLLSPRMAAATVGAYLLEGAAGLPVFAPGPGGLAHLLGPTGGYLLAYPLAAMLISTLWRRTGRGFAAALASGALGDLAILIGGALWLTVTSHGSLWASLSFAVVPFLPGDAIKVAVAAGVAASWHRLRRQSE